MTRCPEEPAPLSRLSLHRGRFRTAAPTLYFINYSNNAEELNGNSSVVESLHMQLQLETLIEKFPIGVWELWRHPWKMSEWSTLSPTGPVVTATYRSADSYKELPCAVHLWRPSDRPCFCSQARHNWQPGVGYTMGLYCYSLMWPRTPQIKLVLQ